MDNPDLQFEETFTPCTEQIDFLTEKINEESRAQNITSDAYPFGLFLRHKKFIKDGRSSNIGTSESNKSSAITISSSPLLSTAASFSPSSQLETTGSDKHEKPQDELIVGGCNGSIVYGSIYTDQLWVDPQYRGKGIGKMLMEKVHELGTRKNCTFATVGTMNFQNAQKFYERLGYEVEFERKGYSNGGIMIYLRKNL